MYLLTYTHNICCCIIATMHINCGYPVDNFARVRQYVARQFVAGRAVARSQTPKRLSHAKVCCSSCKRPGSQVTNSTAIVDCDSLTQATCCARANSQAPPPLFCISMLYIFASASLRVTIMYKNVIIASSKKFLKNGKRF